MGHWALNLGFDFFILAFCDRILDDMRIDKSALRYRLWLITSEVRSHLYFISR
ncbi:hypothetical protein [uncultured Nostoc sp.]|uniref:hypothetical protein n=1 Tax=uncultured Nostoc sp. TaxID=340711 RepID=UPI0035CA26E9